jgi:predicted small secreted protein
MSQSHMTLRKLILTGLAAALIPALAACNTVKGAGKDIEKGGEAIQNGADNVQEDMEN